MQYQIIGHGTLLATNCINYLLWNTVSAEDRHAIVRLFSQTVLNF